MPIKAGFRKKSNVANSRPLDHVIETFRDVAIFLKAHFFERNDAIKQAIYAIMTGQHVLYMGEAGTAKSGLIRALLTAFDDSFTEFHIQMSKYLPEEALIGPANPKKLREEGIYEYNTEGMVPEAHFAYFDEIFDANDATLRSMLEVMNERTFTKGHQKKECPLNSAFMSSNFERTEKNIHAFLDRIMFKNKVKYLLEKNSKLEMFKNYMSNQGLPKYDQDRISLEGLALFQAELKNVTIPADVLDLYLIIIGEVSKQGHITVTDRKTNLMLRLLQASALSSGRDTVLTEDLNELRYAIITLGDSKEETIFDGVYAKFIGNISLIKKELDDLTSDIDFCSADLQKVDDIEMKHVDRIKSLNDRIDDFRNSKLSSIGDAGRKKTITKNLDNLANKLSRSAEHLDKL